MASASGKNSLSKGAVDLFCTHIKIQSMQWQLVAWCIQLKLSPTIQAEHLGQDYNCKLVDPFFVKKVASVIGG
jgi:hypothetical protein